MPFIELDVLNAPERPTLGIDLGTTYSLVALWREGRPQVLRPAGRPDGRIPSAIWFPSSAPPQVGWPARDHAVTDPGATILSVKRFMGRGLADARADLASVPFPARETENHVIQFEAQGRAWTPQELSALILKEVWRIASAALGEEAPRRAVITVPAYFDEAQRAATRDAARLAGLEVARIVNEPTAASLAYGLEQKKQGTVVVYDLGGGTFDVSILAIEGGVFRVLATAGDTHLGGDDLDRALVELAFEESGVGAEFRADAAFLQGLRLAAERCKIELSSRSESELHISVPEQRLPWRRMVRREELEQRIQPFVQRTLDLCRRALHDARLQTEQIDEVVLVGGSTRIPHVRAEVARFFGRKPHTELNPDEVVAMGAAVQGHVLGGGTRELLLLDVTPLALGLETLGGAVSKIVLRNSPIPCQATEGFTTHADNQTGIDFHVVQGERELAKDCRTLGRFKLRGIPPLPAGMARVSVRFALDADGLLAVTAREESSGAQATIEVQPMNGLSDPEVERMLKESYAHAREDFDQSRLVNLRVEIASMLRALEKSLPGVRGALDRETLLDIEEASAHARTAERLGDVQAVQRLRDELERAAMPLAAALMDSVAKAALQGKKLSEV
ncbi:MAG: Fe-S protein assembly chaperone HscA [Planctomycetes bacterium]|nr:Fe-S protein assembly chaperone HscA [Planctomycetota bacterium]